MLNSGTYAPPDDPTDKALHDRMVALVERMLELNTKKHSGKLAPSQIERVEREIASADPEIDELFTKCTASRTKSVS